MFARILSPILLLSSVAIADDWPSWRGPTGTGHSTDKNLPLKWGGKDNANVLWKAPLPGVEAKAAPDQNQSSPPCAIIVVIRNRMVFGRFGQDRESSDVTASATRHVHGPAGNVGPIGLAPLRASALAADSAMSNRTPVGMVRLHLCSVTQASHLPPRSQENTPVCSDRSYNQGAGLANGDKLAAGLKVAMPLEAPDLTEQAA